MKPLHAKICRVNRCRCCVSSYTWGHNKAAMQSAKSAARQSDKRNIKKELAG